MLARRAGENKGTLQSCIHADDDDDKYTYSHYLSLFMRDGPRVPVDISRYGENPLSGPVKLNALHMVRFLCENGAPLYKACFVPCIRDINLVQAAFWMARETFVYLLHAGSDVIEPEQTTDDPERYDILSWLLVQLKIMCGNYAKTLISAGFPVKSHHLSLVKRSPHCEPQKIAAHLDWLLQRHAQPQSLSSICRRAIRRSLLKTSNNTSILPRIPYLPLPPVLISYVGLEDKVFLNSVTRYLFYDCK